MQSQLREHQEAREQLTRRIEELIKESRLLRENDERHFKELMETIRRLEETIAQRDRTINDKDTTIKKLTSDSLEQ